MGLNDRIENVRWRELWNDLGISLAQFVRLGIVGLAHDRTVLN